jgi:maltooligosyltrehalose synthase
LARIGISHAYASPYLKARPGSAHGYDIVDHGQLNPGLGNEPAFRDMVKEFDLFVLTMANASALSPNAITAMADSRHHV